MEPDGSENDEKYQDIPEVSDGYAFYHKLGSPQKIVAPMVDQSDLCFRMQTRSENLCFFMLQFSILLLADMQEIWSRISVHPDV